MKHEESVIKVYRSERYSIFSYINGNRDIRESKIKKMIKDIKNGLDFLPDFPIVVAQSGQYLTIIDGQHRFECAKQTKRPVYYIIRKESISLEKIAKINSIQEKWRVRDFIECYTAHGNKHYRELANFQDKYGFPVSVSLNLLYHGITGSDSLKEKLTDLFRSGLFEIKHQKQAIEIAEAVKNFSKFPGWNSRPFILAIAKVLAADVCDFDVLIKKFNEDPGTFSHKGSAKEYLFQLEQIYNKGFSKRRTIH